MRVVSCAWVGVGALALVGCADHRAPAGVAASGASASVVTSQMLPPPTRVDAGSSQKMRYYYWDPGVSVAELGTDRRSRAEAVLASATVRDLLGAAAGDGFVYERSDEKKPMATFRQTRDVRGQHVIVDGAYASVELEEETRLIYIGTGFVAGVTLPDGDLTVDEARAEAIAVAAYSAQEKSPGKATPHQDSGLRVKGVRGTGMRLVYPIHVERAEGEGHSRPFMFLVDAQRGEVVHQYQAWVE